MLVATNFHRRGSCGWLTSSVVGCELRPGEGSAPGEGGAYRCWGGAVTAVVVDGAIAG